MAVKIRFYGVEPIHYNTFIECDVIEGEIGIRLENSIKDFPIIIDKQTAIRLVRELRKQIALIN